MKGVFMHHWLYPANTKYYDIFAALKQPEAVWPMNTQVSIGDTIYLYLSAPYKQIGFVTKVVNTQIPHDEAITYAQPYFKQATTDNSQKKAFMLLADIHAINIKETSMLSYTKLKENGLNGMLMGPRKLENNPQLLSYIKEQTNAATL